MAHAHTDAAPRGNFFSGFFDSIIKGLAAIGEANNRMQEVERLNALSDEKLAKMGLQRTDIVRHVFRDCLYI